MSDSEKFWEDFSFLENVSLWDVVKAVLAVVILYSLVYTIWQAKVQDQGEQRLMEVGAAVTALAHEGYDIYIDGEKECFIPDIENYFIEFDVNAQRIDLTRRTTSEKDMLLSFVGLGKYGDKGGFFSWLKK